jgi:hypothetical protein
MRRQQRAKRGQQVGSEMRGEQAAKQATDARRWLASTAQRHHIQHTHRWAATHVVDWPGLPTGSGLGLGRGVAGAPVT